MSARPEEFPSPSSCLQTDQNDTNKVKPRFFGHSSIYQNGAPHTAPPLPTENSYCANPPPAYSPTPNEPKYYNSFAATDPSAPPLELPLTPHILHDATPKPTSPPSFSSSSSSSAGIYPPVNYQNQQKPPENYPPQGYGHYGAVNQQQKQQQKQQQQQQTYASPNITTSDANRPIVSNWPWISPPNGGGGRQPLMGYPVPLPQRQPPYYNPDQKQKSCFGLSLKYVFYFFCICLVMRLIGLLSGDVSHADSCLHGFIWRSLPEQFEFSNNGLRIRVIGGSLSGGHITFKKRLGGGDGDDACGGAGGAGDSDDDAASSTGLVKLTALVSPASLADEPELNYSLTRLDNEGTTLEIYIPHDLSSSRACVSLNAIIYLPDTLEFISLDVQNTYIDSSKVKALNIDKVSLSTTNSAIELGPRWVGNVLELTTANARIEINQAIENAETVVVSTTNGGIRFKQPIRGVAGVISAQTTNSGIDVDTYVDAPAVELTTTNGHLNVENVRAERAELKTTNGRIGVHHANIFQVINVQTTNGALALHVDEGNHAEVIVQTTNSPVSLKMPAEHEGRFEMETSRTNKIEFVDPHGWSHQLIYNKGYLAGARYIPAGRPDKKPDTAGHLQVKTTNANIHVHYANSAV